MSTEKKMASDDIVIAYVEEDIQAIQDFVDELAKRYLIQVGAYSDEVFKKRSRPYSLIILDIMIHRENTLIEDGKEVKRQNIGFEGIHWTETGLEFLRRVRDGKLTNSGFPKDIPVIIATARVDESVRQFANSLLISGWLEKPFTIDELEGLIDRALASK
jgi:CheY-like chemotaxis protein